MRFVSSLLVLTVVTGVPRGEVRTSDPKDLNAVVADMVTALKEANPGKQPKRTGVITFVSTKQESGGRNDFGEYLTETFISELNSIRNLYKLFERKRLDVVLKENDFMLSDLVNQAQAQKLGELLPIDVIFSGTYTKLKSYVDVNARLIDVVTGEILVSFSGRILLTADLQSLFGEETSSAGSGAGAAKPSALDLCKEKAKGIKTKLNDLSSEDKVRSVVSDVMKIPFDVECGTVHFDVMYSFKRYKIENDPYHRFLLETLDTIPYPSTDERSLEIFKYLVKDNVVDREEWKAGLGTIRRAGGYLSTYLRTLFRLNPLPDDLTELQERIDEYFEAARSGKVGLPAPVTFNAAFFAMTDALKSEDDIRLRFYVYERYGRSLEPDPRTYKSTIGLLTHMYKYEKDRARKTTVLQWIADFFNEVEGYDKAHDQLYEFVRYFELTSNKTTNEEILLHFPEEDVRTLVELCRPKFAEYALKATSNSQREDRIHFCVRYNIPLPGVIPSMEEAVAALDGSDLAEQRRILELMEMMGARPKPAEAALVRLLDRKSVDQKKEMMEAQESALVILGNIHSENPKAIAFMIEQLGSFEYGMADKAEAALVQIGKPAVGALVKKLGALSVQQDGLSYKIVRILGKMGKEASAARPTLQALLQKTTNKDVRYVIEAALQAMQ
jgi:TolB-like protein